MTEVLLNIGLVLIFIVIGGIFAAAEIALVSLREGQVRAMAERGKRGKRVAKLAEDPNRFLAAVQIGVTLAGFMSAAFGAATLANQLSPLLENAGLSARLAGVVAIVVVTVIIAYFSMVFSELAPKRIGLQRAEGVAQLLGPPLERIATLSRPLIWLLSLSTDLAVRMLGGDPRAQREAITEEELRDLVSAHESLTRDERKIMEEVFAAGDSSVREVMIPRTEVAFLEDGMPVMKAQQVVAASPHSRFPVYRGSHDDVVGFVHVRDLYGPVAAQRTARVGGLTREIARFPENKKVLPTLGEMRDTGHHIAVIIDEYGGTAGIVTLEDLIEELIGDIRDEYDVQADDSRRLRGGALEVDGLLNLDDFADATGIELPEGPYETVAGYVMAMLGRVPLAGDEVTAPAATVRVTALDGRRVSRVLVTPAADPQQLAEGPGTASGSGAVGSGAADQGSPESSTATAGAEPPAGQPAAEPAAMSSGSVALRDQ